MRVSVVIHFEQRGQERLGYSMIRLRWPAAILCLTLVTAIGCEDGPDLSSGVEDVVDLSGVWDITGVLIISRRVTVCSDTGSVRFEQDGQAITASGSGVSSCHGLLGDFELLRPLTLTDGEVVDSFISFTLVGVCGCDQTGCRDARYIGTIHSDPPRMVGSSACSVNFDGDWEATPAAPIATLDLEPDSVDMVVGEKVFLEPVLRAASGARVFERSVVWSVTEPAVVSVDNSGVVEALDIGPATVTARVAEGVSDEVALSSKWLNFASAEVGLFHTCGLGTDGATYCWGANDVGQSGPAPSLAPCGGVTCRRAPGAVPSQALLTELSTGFQNTCGLADDGLAYCWGGNSAGQLGRDSSVASTAVPLAVSGGRIFESLSVGTNHTCGVTSGGEAYCWGANNRGQLGSPKEELSYSVTPVAVSGGMQFSSVSSGEVHTCGLHLDGAAYCWGWNWWGQLGNDSIPDSAVPVLIPGGVVFESLTSGAHHICGLTQEGKAYCWGRGTQGQLGVEPGEFGFNVVPVAIDGDLTFQSLSAGEFHTCGVGVDGAAYCWGDGRNGRLGDGNETESLQPVAVAGGLTFSSVSAGREHTCGQTTGGLVYCWGSNFNGQLGILELSDFPTPQLVIGQPR